jgi:nucleotide-binding universal stress UspA family protein
MSIVCGTDFSEASKRAVDAAAQLAARMNVPLHLVHASDLAKDELVVEPVRDTASYDARRLLLEKERVAALGADVRVHAREGVPDEILLDVATREQAQLIIVAALGRRSPGKWQLGSHADRIAQSSHVPVLVVRAAQPFQDWVAGLRPLNIVLGVDFSLSSEHAMRWVAELCALGPCKITALHLYWPPEQFKRLGLTGVRDYMGPHPEVARTLQAQLASRLAEVFGTTTIRLLVQPNLGRAADRIARQAADDEADLLVVGSHVREPLERVMQGSVSRGVLHCSAASVACVPAPHSLARRPRRIANVLVATDLTDTGNAALALAYSLVAAGGKVRLAHVVPQRPHRTTEPHDIFASEGAISPSEVHAAAERRLRELVPPGSSGHAETSVHVLESDSPADAIAQAAERLDADLICLGTHGGTGLKRALLGSVAQAVLHATERPVLFARKPRA